MEINNSVISAHRLHDMEQRVLAMQNVTIANVIMISEIHSPTYGERERAKFFIERLSDQRLHNCSTDDLGNAFGVLNGSEKKRNILIAAHLDNNFDDDIDHTVQVHTSYLQGAGIGDNSLGVGVLMTLPSILEQLGIQLKSNLIIMGTVHSLGTGDIAGIRYFLDNTDIPIDSAIFVEGIKLGRLSVDSPGMIRGKVIFEVESEYDWRRGDVPNAVVYLNEIVDKILALPLPSRPKTTIAINSFNSGNSFNWIPSAGKLRFEIRSASSDMVKEVHSKIEHICDEVSSRTSAHISLETIARRDPGGLPYSHPLVTTAKRCLDALDCRADFVSSTSELSACIEKHIPAVTIGLSDSKNINMPHEQLMIKDIPKGVAQLIAMLLAIDAGECDA